jgi:hypothetical protein
MFAVVDIPVFLAGGAVVWFGKDKILVAVHGTEAFVAKLKVKVAALEAKIVSAKATVQADVNAAKATVATVETKAAATVTAVETAVK